MTRAANVFRLGVKELRSLRHDPVLLVFLLWAFSGGIYAAASATSTGLHNAPIAVVDEDRSPLSRQIVAGFYPPYFATPDLISVSDADRGLDSGRYTFVLDIPPEFQRDVLNRKQPAIQANIDATRMTQAFIGSSYIQNIVAGEVSTFVNRQQRDRVLPIDLAIRMRFNPNLTSAWFGSVMEIINNITMLSIILTGAALIREREHGTIEHLLVMPVTPFQIMLSKVWANGLVVLVGAGLSLLLVVQGLLSVPIAGSVPLFLAGTALHLFSTTAMGIFLGTLARSMPQLGLLLILVILPLQLLSGGVTPRESMPEIVQTIMLGAPTTYFVRFSQAILYRGAGFDAVWADFAAIVAIGLAFFALALSLFRRSISAAQ